MNMKYWSRRSKNINKYLPYLDPGGIGLNKIYLVERLLIGNITQSLDKSIPHGMRGTHGMEISKITSCYLRIL